MSIARSLVRALTPMGVAQLSEYAARFRRLGYPASWSVSAERRALLRDSNVELLPESVRRAPAVVIDGGANRGDWSASILELLHPSRLLAFEPQPHVFAELKARLASHPEAECHAVGLGASAAELEMHVEVLHQLSSFKPLRDNIRVMHGQRVEARRSVKVPVRPLDEFTAGVERVGVLKLDVQGFEEEVLRGASETLARTSCVLLEVLYESYYEGDAPFDTLHRIMVDKGFRTYAISAPAVSPAGQHLWSDVAYVRRGAP